MAEALHAPGRSQPRSFPTALARPPTAASSWPALFDWTTFNTMWSCKTDHVGNVRLVQELLDVRRRAVAATASAAWSQTADGGFAFAGSVAVARERSASARSTRDGDASVDPGLPGRAVDGRHAAALVETPDGGSASRRRDRVLPGLRRTIASARPTRPAPSLWDEQIGATGSPTSPGIVDAHAADLVRGGLRDSPAARRPWRSTTTAKSYWQRATRLKASDMSGIGIVPAGGWACRHRGRRPDSARRATLLELDAAGCDRCGRRPSRPRPTSYPTSRCSLVPTLDGGFLAVGSDVRRAHDSRLLAVKVDAGGDFVGCLDVEMSGSVDGSRRLGSPSPMRSTTVVDETANTDGRRRARDAHRHRRAPSGSSARARCRQTLEPAALVVDPSGNGVADPGEQFAVEPSWTNFGLVGDDAHGPHLRRLGLERPRHDGSGPDADYGTVASLATADCGTATGDCYAVAVPRHAAPVAALGHVLRRDADDLGPAPPVRQALDDPRRTLVRRRLARRAASIRSSRTSSTTASRAAAAARATARRARRRARRWRSSC